MPIFLDEFTELLSIVSTNSDNIMILGDFNLHVDNAADSRAVGFLKLLSSMDFTQHVNKPTHNRGHTLDLIITHGLRIDVSSVIDLASQTSTVSFSLHYHHHLALLLSRS